MRYELINTGSYLLVVSDEEIKEGDYWCNVHLNSNYIDTKAPKESGRFAMNSNAFFANPKKIVAHLPLNNSPILDGVDLLPPLEQKDDVEKIARSHYSYEPDDYEKEWYAGFINGYNKAKEKYKFTEFDMISAFEYGWNQRHYGIKDEEELREIQKRFIQSLSQPKMPVGFECETEKVFGVESPDFSEQPKTTTNSQGQTVLVGRYIYE